MVGRGLSDPFEDAPDLLEEVRWIYVLDLLGSSFDPDCDLPFFIDPSVDPEKLRSFDDRVELLTERIS